MLTRFISDKIFKPLDFEYQHDSNVKIDSYQVGVDGNLNYSITPSLSSIKDLKVNNYTLNILGGNEKLTNFLSIEQLPDIKNSICYIYFNSDDNILNDNTLFWKFETNFISVSTSLSAFNDSNIFEIEFLDELKCKLFYNSFNQRYALAYSTSLSSINFIPTNSDNFNNYYTIFDYIYEKNDNQLFLYCNTNLGQYAIELENKKLVLKNIKEYEKLNRFFIKKINNLNDICATSDWVSYENGFNKNNINLESNRSFYDTKNNILISSLLGSISSTIPINILTLKNQLNQENLQSRGNVFLNENEECNLKEYESIFTGGFRESGFSKINLGYTSYTTPYNFKSGKTTYFHVPHDIYPYKKLNVNSSKLAESGAIGGSCPLNSDKMWKKMADYRETSPFGNAQEENSGQLLCTWLSAGPSNERPIWVDRFYKPNLLTPFQAMSAIPNEIKYKSSFDCYDLDNGIKDVLSSLTFENGCYYSYMHLGKIDYVNLIESLSGKIFYKELEDYKKTNFIDLDKTSKIYNFDGKTYGLITLDEKIDYNQITFSFFANKENWLEPTGNQIFGNYTNKGFGFFNYMLNSAYILLKKNSNTLQILNNKFEEISNISTLNITKSAIKGVSRRNGLENLHIITDDFQMIEVDINGTIVDMNTNLKNTLSGDYILSVSNDDTNCYVQSNSAVIKIDLNSNNAEIATITNTIGTGTNSFILSDASKNLYVINGGDPTIRGDNIYFIDKNQIKVYLTSSNTLSSFLVFDKNISTFNIDYDGKFYVICQNELFIYNGQYSFSNSIKLSTMDLYSLTAHSISFIENFENGELKKLKNVFLKNNEESYVLLFDELNNLEYKKLNYNYDLTQLNSNISNYNYNAQYMLPTYNKSSYNFKIKLTNPINSEDSQNLIFMIKGSDLSSGKKHFVFTINCLEGIADFYLNGELYERKDFLKGKYVYSDTFNGAIYYGCDSFFNGIPAFQHFKDVNDFTYKDLSLEKNYILNKYVDKFEALYFYREEYPPNDLIYNIPSGSRSFIDCVEKLFNFNLPQYKSGKFDLNISNSGIFYEDIRRDIEIFVTQKLEEFLPAHVDLRKINWLDTVLRPIYLEGNYNQSNTLTNLQ